MYADTVYALRVVTYSKQAYTPGYGYIQKRVYM